MSIKVEDLSEILVGFLISWVSSKRYNIDFDKRLVCDRFLVMSQLRSPKIKYCCCIGMLCSKVSKLLKIYLHQT